VGVVSKKLDQRRKTPEEAHAEIRLAIEAAAQEAGTDADVILRAVELKFAGAANLPSLVFPLLADLKVSAAKKEVIAAVDEVSNEIKVYVACSFSFFSRGTPRLGLWTVLKPGRQCTLCQWREEAAGEGRRRSECRKLAVHGAAGRRRRRV
jgi:hypothetical protein